jgi:prephenate dehydratase
VTSALRIGFFGPSGTFTEQALLTQADLAKATTVPFRTVPDVLDAVESGEVDLGFVPIENSIKAPSTSRKTRWCSTTIC